MNQTNSRKKMNKSFQCPCCSRYIIEGFEKEHFETYHSGLAHLKENWYNMNIKILVCNLNQKGIKEFEEEYKKLIEDHYRVEETYEQEGAIIFHMEQWK